LTAFLATFLARVLEAHAEADPREVVSALAAQLVTAGLVTPARLAQAERDARIYALRPLMSTRALSERFQITERQVKRIVRNQRDTSGRK
jgi:Mor family transcriptional regulator